MKTKIKEIQDYFKNKIVNGEYEIIKVDEHTCDIVIDGEYRFCIWTSNGEQFFKQYTTYGDHFLTIGDFTDEQKSKGYKLMKERAEGILAEQQRKEDLQKFNELKSKLGL